MRKGIFVGMAALLAVSAMAQGATVLVNDNFESYADDAAFKAVWNGAAAPLSSLAVGGGKGGGNGVVTSGGAVAQKNFASTLVPTAASGNWIELEADMWDYSTGSADRNTVGIRSASAIIEFGEYNSMDPDLAVSNNTMVQGYGFRTVYMGGPAQTTPASQSWVMVVPNANKITNADPAIGYHHLKMTINQSSLTATITLSNGVVYSKTVSLTQAAGDAFDNVRIGGPSGVSSTGTSIFDNVKVSVVPEPASMLLLGLGGLLLRRRRA